ncbi:MAG: hypothetical protein C0501_20335 [Isosphaera sp.]|nr:hypothetical protein [Isosphaera sp.]
MSTLDALHRAVIADPADRTVRLAYADALDEAGDPASAARAEFIRAQIELDATPEPLRRHYELSIRSRELFEEHWPDWWRPVCTAAGLPEPHGPGRRGRRRPWNWPYTHVSGLPHAVNLADHLTVQFGAGFPEEVRFRNFDAPAGLPDVDHRRWGDAIPLVRLNLGWDVTPDRWARVDGPHLARLPELELGRLPVGTAAAVAASAHLAAVARLSADLTDAGADAVRALVAGPPWAGLRELHLTGHLDPPAVRELAAACTLRHLEEVSVALRRPGGLGALAGEVLSRMIRVLFARGSAPEPPEAGWRDFGPALEALAVAPWVRRLRRLRITAGRFGLLGDLGRRLDRMGRDDDFLPDAAVRALAAAAETGKLDSLVLPAGLVRDPVREELARPGGRVSFA